MSDRRAFHVRAPSLLRNHPVVAACTGAAVVVVTPQLNGALPGLAGNVVVCVLAYGCGSHASLREGSLAVVALMVALQVQMGFSEFPNVEIAFTTVGPLWVGHQVRRRSQLVSTLADRSRELEAEQDAFVRLAVRRERARIARELHDIVAHHLAVIVVQAGAGRMARLGSSERAAERLSTIREAGGQALAEMARLVDILHTDDSDKRDAAAKLQLLLDEAKASGLAVRVVPLPLGAELPAEIEDNAYRIVREGLTNAIKHAPGAEVQIRLALRDDKLEVEVHDSGGKRPTPLADTGSGLGLIGMRERVESTEGTLEAGPDPDGGWRLRATLPVVSPTVLPSR
jgi:signal transduction histidine kinase